MIRGMLYRGVLTYGLLVVALSMSLIELACRNTPIVIISLHHPIVIRISCS